MRRPRPFSVGDVRARVIRGPKGGLWYWRAERYRGEAKSGATIWTGWASPQDALLSLAALVAEGGDVVPSAQRRASREPCSLRTVRDLMELWLQAREARADLQAGTKTADRVASNRLKAALGDVALDRLALPTLERFRDARIREGAAHASAQLDFT